MLSLASRNSNSKLTYLKVSIYLPPLITLTFAWTLDYFKHIPSIFNTLYSILDVLDCVSGDSELEGSSFQNAIPQLPINDFSYRKMVNREQTFLAQIFGGALGAILNSFLDDRSPTLCAAKNIGLF